MFNSVAGRLVRTAALAPTVASSATGVAVPRAVAAVAATDVGAGGGIDAQALWRGAAGLRRPLHTSTAPKAGKRPKKGQKKPKGGASKADREKVFFTKIGLGEHQRFYQPPADAAESAWTPDSLRTGVITLKCGMTADWDTYGQRHPLTVLQLEDVQVTQIKREEVEGFNALQIGAGEAKPKNVTQPMKGHFARAGVAPKLVTAEFRVSPDAFLEPGTTISARHFVPGQYVDVQGVSRGKGFQGAMRRWGFRGQGASHGNSKSHRSHGSTGSGQGPGKVWKGKKMAGRMGGKRVTVEGLQVYKVDAKRNLLYLKGSVPGFAGSYVKVKDSRKNPHQTPPPFPTFTPTEEDVRAQEAWEAGKRATLPSGKEIPFEIVAQPPEHDPFGIHEWDEATID